jgi:cyclopropane-fatty-acyl-phospholipid synthase
MDPARIAAELFASGSRSFTVRLWDGTVLPAERDGGARGSVVLRDPDALDAFFPPAAEPRLAEAVLDGRIELEGDAIGLIEAAARWQGPRLRLPLAKPVLSALLRRALHRDRSQLEARLRGGRHSVGRDREAVRHHYDVSDEFYRVFLGDELVYSCAYFAEPGLSLEDAQRAKLDLVCRKLRLSAGERFLDVGCGWGALVEHAALRYGARALGITVSANQLAVARARLARAAGGADAEFLAEDYRTLRADAPFDKVASIGMMEHVGRARLGAYFAAVHRLLRPGGLFLNHAIAFTGGGAPTLPWAHQRDGGFIWRYVFPDGELIPVAQVIGAAERAGFEVRDLECLREHYAETLAAWLSRLEERYAQAVAIVGERRARLYRLYLAASAVGFRIGRTSVYQLLLARRSESGAADGLPRSRAEWYAEPFGSAAAAAPAPGSSVSP